MSLRRSAIVAGASVLVLVVHVLLVRYAAEEHVAHVLLGADPPAFAAVIAVALVLVRLAAIVVVPGALLAAAASVAAHVLVGPRQRDDEVGMGSKSGTGISVADDGGTGTSIGARGTK